MEEGSDQLTLNLQPNRRRLSTVKRRRKVARAHHLPCASAFRGISGNEFIWIPHFVYVMKYEVPLVLGLVTLKYQGKPDILFLKNPVPVCCFVAATFIYWLIVGAMKQIKTLEDNWLQILSNVVLASGILSPLSLLAIFLPYPVSLMPLLIWTPLPLILSCPQTFRLFHRCIINAVNKTRGKLVRAREIISSPNKSSLPV